MSVGDGDRSDVAPVAAAASVEASGGASGASPGAAAAPYHYLPHLFRVLFVIAGVLPWLVLVARAYLPLGQVGVVLDAVFIPTCHRIPSRTLLLAGVLMPICSRCAGIFAGVAIGAVIARPRVSMAVWRWVLGFAAAIMILEVASQDAGIHPVYHPTRLATGLLVGYAMSAAFVTNIWPFNVKPPRS